MAALSLKKHFWKDNVIKKVVKTTFLLQIILQKKNANNFNKNCKRLYQKRTKAISPNLTYTNGRGNTLRLARFFEHVIGADISVIVGKGVSDAGGVATGGGIGRSPRHQLLRLLWTESSYFWQP
jgi:hypothetical protein